MLFLAESKTPTAFVLPKVTILRIKIFDYAGFVVREALSLAVSLLHLPSCYCVLPTLLSRQQLYPRLLMDFAGTVRFPFLSNLRFYFRRRIAMGFGSCYSPWIRHHM
ncbi:unnamed protein product [Linum trigynum]|uniref:Uncharacterized protein n=1 Tax=Linum trigynum TaxID=586398 RepID=A0AAV2CHV2_9ROSI